MSKVKHLNLNDPVDARYFLNTALNEAMNQGGLPNITQVTLAGGRVLKIADMNDSEAVQYACELISIYEAAFPGSTEVHHEQ